VRSALCERFLAQKTGDLYNFQQNGETDFSLFRAFPASGGRF
jgi:hypothetical protein